jgi:hypothetical protein
VGGCQGLERMMWGGGGRARRNGWALGKDRGEMLKHLFLTFQRCWCCAGFFPKPGGKGLNVHALCAHHGMALGSGFWGGFLSLASQGACIPYTIFSALPPPKPLPSAKNNFLNPTCCRSSTLHLRQAPSHPHAPNPSHRWCAELG